MPRGFLTRLGRSPGDAATLLQLDHVVLADVALRESHGEDITDGANSLPAGRFQEIVVAVPARLLTGIGDELEELPDLGRNIAVGADNAQILMGTAHGLIEAHDPDGWRHQAATPSALSCRVEDGYAPAVNGEAC